MQYQHTKREPEMAELIEGSERDRRRLAELLDGIRVGPGVDVLGNSYHKFLEIFLICPYRRLYKYLAL